MTLLRLLVSFKADHHILPVGLTIGLPVQLAGRLVELGLAEYAEPLTATVAPQETRRRGRPLGVSKIAR